MRIKQNIKNTNTMYNQGLFKNSVPKLAMLLLILLLLIVILLASPIYTGNIGQMASSTGLMSEYFIWANYASTIGMAVAMPLVMRMKTRFRSKELMIGTLVTMALMTFVIATTQVAEVIVGAGFLFGVAKMFAMIEVIIPTMFIISKTGDRGKFYPIFYPLVIIVAQLGGILASNLSLLMTWQMIHIYSAGILLLVAMLCVPTMHNQRFARKMPFYQIDWLSIGLFATSLMTLAYVLTFGKQQAWFVSSSIMISSLVSIGTMIWLIARQNAQKRPYISFKLFKQGNVQAGMILLTALGMFMAAGSVVSIYTNAVLGYNWMINASLGLMSIPGMIVGGFVAFHWMKHKMPLKMYIFSGFGAYILYMVVLYFMMIPGLNIESFYLPQLLNGYGMSTLFISVWIFTLDKIPQKDMLPSIGLIMVFRSFVATALFGAIFSWMHYRLQWQSVSNLAVYFDTTLMSNNLGVGNYRDVQLSAILAANKALLGYIIIAGIGILSFVLFHQFGSLKYKVARYNFYRAERIIKREKRKIARLPESVDVGI